MSRPKQDGLLYFSFDTDFFYADKRIKRLHAKYGNDGLIFYIYLLTEIYRNGYYVSWNEEVAEDIADDLHFKEGFTEQVMKYLVSRSLLTMSTLTNSVTIITSPGIQRRYQEAKKGSKRQIEVDSEIWLLSESETASCIKVTKNPNNSEKNPSFSEKNESNSEKNHTKESKGKEIKEKESKGNQSKGDICPEPEQPASAPPVISLILNDKSLHDVFESDIEGWKELYPAVDILQEFKKMKGWLDSNPDRRKTRRGINRFINSWLSRAQDSGGTRGRSGNYNGQTAQMLENHYSMVDEWVRKKEMEEGNGDI